MQRLLGLKGALTSAEAIVFQNLPSMRSIPTISHAHVFLRPSGTASHGWHCQPARGSLRHICMGMHWSIAMPAVTVVPGGQAHRPAARWPPSSMLDMQPGDLVRRGWKRRGGAAG